MTGGLRVGIIGAGFGQHVQVPAFRSDPRASVQAICASTDARAQTIARRLDIPRAFGDWRQLITDPEIDAVGVSVPPALQAQIVLAAVTAGKHVLAEKPLGMNAGEARAMRDAVGAAGVVGAVDFEFRELEVWRRVRVLLAEGRLGRLRHVYFSWRIETLAYRENRVTWKRDPLQGGGTLNLFGSHALDTILWAFGPANRVTAQLLALTPGTAESRVEAWLEILDGPAVSLSIAADAPLGGGYRIEVYGDNGALVLENRTSDYASGFTLAWGRRGETMTAIDLPPLPAGVDGRIAATSHVVHRFLDAIETRAPMSPNFDDGLAVQQLIDALREANRRGTWQSLS